MRVLTADEAVTSVQDLEAVPLFRRLDAEQRRLVLEYAEVVQADAGETIFEEGDPGGDLFVLLSGAGAILTRTGDGDPIQVGEVQPGETFGELGALLDAPRAATVMLSEGGCLLRLSAAAVTGLLDRVGPLGLAMARELARDLEVALGERNALRIDASPDRVVVASQDLTRTRVHLARYYLATMRNVVRRHRLLTAATHPPYVSEFRVPAEEMALWRGLFGTPDDVVVPYTTHATAWTMLLMQLVEDLGVNARQFSHLRTRLTLHAGVPGTDPGASCGLRIDLTDTVPLDGDEAALLTQTRVFGDAGAILLTSEDTFVVGSVDRATLRSLRASARVSADDPRVARPSVDRPALSDRATSIGLALTEDLGARYGRLSGNLNPVHTSRAAARLLGHPQPYLQHLCLVNLVLRYLVEASPVPLQQLELTFVAPVYVDQTVQLRFDGQHVELIDADEALLVHGWFLRAGTTAPPGPRPTTAQPAEETEGEERLEPVGVSEAALAVDPVALLRFLDGRSHDLRQRLRERLSDASFAYPLELSRDAYREWVLARCRTLADEGYGALAFPHEVGGAGDPAAALAAFETIAQHDLSLLVKFGVQFGLFGGAILHLGTAQHHERHLRDVGTLALPGCFALTETGHGSDARAICTRAVYDLATDEFVIDTPDDDARKDYIGNAGRDGRMAAVFAQLEVGGQDQGVHALLVPIRDADGRPAPGVRIEDCGPKLGLNGVDNGRLWFDDVRVPRDALLDRYGHVSVDGVYTSPIDNPSARFFTMLSALVQGRLAVGLAGISASKSALAIAVRYGARRRQFAPRHGDETILLDYLSHQRRLLPRLATTYALDVAMHAVVADYIAIFQATSPSPREKMQLETLAAGLKAMATWHATDTIQGCREACGAKGYLAENRFAALKADTDVFTTFEGDNTVLLQLVTKTLLTDYKQQFEDMDLRGLVKFMVGRVLAAVVPTPASRNTDEAHLRSRAFQLEAFRTREELMLADLARRLKRTLDRGTDPHDAFIRHQHRVLEVGRAHVERVALERFVARIDTCRDPELVPVLSHLCDLFALVHLERDRGWYLQQGLFAAPKTRAIVSQVNRLCGELRPHAVDLVDAFGVPDPLLAAPIAVDD